MRISDWSSDVCSSDLTVYPSHYEGWGLPVTEALAHGQIPVIADNSSLPEAGNGFALTFRSGSVASFVEASAKMVFDRGWKAARERETKAAFKPCSWQQLGRQPIAPAARITAKDGRGMWEQRRVGDKWSTTCDAGVSTTRQKKKPE